MMMNSVWKLMLTITFIGLCTAQSDVELTKAALDLNKGALSLEFTEEDVSLTGVSLLGVQSGPSSSAQGVTTYWLSDGVQYVVGTTLLVILSPDDLAALQLNEKIATTGSNTYFVTKASWARDSSGERLQAIRSASATPMELTLDRSRPSLRAWDLFSDRDSLEVELSMSEPIPADLVRVDGMQLSSSLDLSSASEIVNFPSDATIANHPADPFRLVVTMSANALRNTQIIGQTREDTFLSLSATSLTDVAENQVVPEVLQVRLLDADLVSPTLESLIIDLDGQGYVSLIFSEEVKLASFNRDQVVIGIQSQNAISDGSRVPGFDTLVLAEKTDEDMINSDITGTRVRIALRPEELHMLLRFSEVTGSFLVFPQSGMVQDLVGNPLKDAPQVAAALALVDQTSPTLMSFSLDLHSRVLSLKFDEPARGLKVDGLMLASSPFFCNVDSQESRDGIQTCQSPAAISFSGGAVNYIDEESSVVLQISDVDAEQIQLYPTLAYSRQSTYLSVSPDTVFDIAGNALVEIPRSRPVAVSELVLDVTAPRLVSFQASEHTSWGGVILELAFDEVVSHTDIDSDNIMLWVNDNSFPVDIQEVTRDLNEPTFLILSLTQESTSPIRQALADEKKRNRIVSLALAPGAFKDMNGNSNIQTSVQAATFDIDIKAPTVVSWELNLSQDAILIDFSEPIDLKSFDAHKLVIQSSAKDPDQAHRLSADNEVQIGQSDSSVLVSLGVHDAAVLKKEPTFYKLRATSFLVADALTVTDLVGNGNEIVSSNSALRATSVFGDGVSPTVISFNLDLQDKFIVLEFSEPIAPATLRPASFILVNGAAESLDSPGVRSYALSISQEIHAVDSNQRFFNFALPEADVKSFTEDLAPLASSKDTTFLIASESAAADVSGNFLQAISITDPLPVSELAEAVVGSEESGDDAWMFILAGFGFVVAAVLIAIAVRIVMGKNQRNFCGGKKDSTKKANASESRSPPKSGSRQQLLASKRDSAIIEMNGDGLIWDTSVGAATTNIKAKEPTHEETPMNDSSESVAAGDVLLAIGKSEADISAQKVQRAEYLGNQKEHSVVTRKGSLIGLFPKQLLAVDSAEIEQDEDSSYVSRSSSGSDCGDTRTLALHNDPEDAGTTVV